MTPKRVAILISGRGSNMAALIDAAAEPDYPAQIVLVAANRADAAGLIVAQQAGLATAVVESQARSREAFEDDLQRLLDDQRAELICLAGFMRLFTAAFVTRWHGAMLNIHPALLPSFKGLDTHERALADGVKIHGATVHFVVPEMDAGPIVAQGAVAVLDNDTPETLAARVLAVEHRLYPLALALVASGDATLDNGRVKITGAATDVTPLIVPSDR